jgi:hypothetical protein
MCQTSNNWNKNFDQSYYDSNDLNHVTLLIWQYWRTRSNSRICLEKIMHCDCPLNIEHQVFNLTKYESLDPLLWTFVLDDSKTGLLGTLSLVVWIHEECNNWLEYPTLNLALWVSDSLQVTQVLFNSIFL